MFNLLVILFKFFYKFTNMDIPIFILNFDNEIRKEKMQKRLNNFSIKFLKGYNLSEEEIIQYKINKGVSRNWNIQLSHLEMIKDFYFNTQLEYAIFCEDDVYIHKDLKNNISKIINEISDENFDILLLSYLICNHPANYGEKIDIKSFFYSNFEYYNYNDDLWGAHMYLLKRSYAKYLIDTFTIKKTSEFYKFLR